MDKLYLATIEVAYNNDKLYYVHTKKKWYILKSDMFLDELFRKYSNGCLCYKEKGGEQYPILFGEENYMFGKTHTDDVKRRLSESSKRFNGKNNPMYGKTHTTEVRKRLSEHFTGICNTTQEQRLEHSKRMTGNGNSFYGKNHSEETKMMLSKALGKAVVKLDLEGNFMARFDSSVQANKSISSGNVKDCINKKLYRAGSFLWMHEIDYKENGITKLEHIIAKNRR